MEILVAVSEGGCAVRHWLKTFGTFRDAWLNENPRRSLAGIFCVYNAAMKILSRLILVFWAAALLAACSFGAAPPDPGAQLQPLVEATLLALPTASPLPTYTPYPSPTPFDLKGVFCEYQFCVGHPADVAFFDLSAQKNPVTPSRYDLGIVAAVGANYYIQLTWQSAPGLTDPQFMFDLILIAGADERNGSPQLRLIRGMNVAYVPITSTLLPALTGGGAAAWICGGRVFAWKAYTAQADNAPALFEQAVQKFACGQN